MADARGQLNKFMVDIFHSVLRRQERLLRDSGYGDLSISEMHVIEACAQAQRQGRPYAREIATLLQITPGSLTAAVNVLEKKGYLSRQRDEQDRRRVLIHLNTSALEALQAHEKIHEQLIDEVMGQLSPEESQLLSRALGGVATFFDKERTDGT